MDTNRKPQKPTSSPTMQLSSLKNVCCIHARENVLKLQSKLARYDSPHSIRDIINFIIFPVPNSVVIKSWSECPSPTMFHHSNFHIRAPKSVLSQLLNFVSHGCSNGERWPRAPTDPDRHSLGHTGTPCSESVTIKELRQKPLSIKPMFMVKIDQPTSAFNAKFLPLFFFCVNKNSLNRF